MGSLFEIGKSGVQAYRQALSVTGQNIANVNTDGYNKRAADLEEVPSSQGGVTNIPDQSGLGVRVNQIRRSFDAFLSSNLRDNNAEYLKYKKFVDNLNQLENMLLPNDSDLGKFIGRFFNSLQDVSSRPDEIASRSIVIENGKALANSFNTYSRRLVDFQTSSIKETENITSEINENLKQLAQVNKLVMSGGAKGSSPDILDARDQLLSKLSNYLNFFVDYGKSGEVKITAGDSGKGKILLQETNFSVLNHSIQENKIVFNVNRDGRSSLLNSISSGSLAGIKDYYDVTSNVQSEINDLARRVSRDFNEIQKIGIDLNGSRGSSMFSINSMEANYGQNNSNFNIEIVIEDEDKIKQENINFKFISSLNSWEVGSSSGIKNYNSDNLAFEGFNLKINGVPSDGDQFSLQPSSSNASAFTFLLKDPKAIAAASKNLISASLDNTSKAELRIIGTELDTNKNSISKLEDVFSSSTNPLLASEFLKDGAFATIPTNTNEIKLSSLSKQSSATFGIYDSQIKGFSNIQINLTDGNNINLASAATDPGDGIRSVKELADMLNSGLLLDGLSQHNFRKFGLFASGSDGGLTISSSKSEKLVSSASILSNGNTYTASISQIAADKAKASDIQIFTRDGRHISGTSLEASEVASLFKESNGFLKNAEYRNDYLNTNYRGVEINRISSIGDHVYDFGTNISYDKQITDEDGLFTNKNATSLSGLLTLDGDITNSNDLDGYVTITNSLNDTAINYTVKGYDQDGNYQTETISGGNNSQVTGTKLFKSISSISSSGNGAGEVKIGIKSSGYTLNIENENGNKISSVIPVNSSAYYIAEKLTNDLAGTGIKANALNRVMLGPLSTDTNGNMSFKLKGNNFDPVVISADVSFDDLSNLARVINQYSSQTGINAFSTEDFDRIVLESKEGHDIEVTEINSPSDFKLYSLNQNFERVSDRHAIDISDSNEKSAYINGTIRFESSLEFMTQINQGLLNSSQLNEKVNGFYNINYNSTGEKIIIDPVSLENLDDSVSGPNGKKSQAGISTYGISIPVAGYRVHVLDDDSLYAQASPVGSGTQNFSGGFLKDSNDLNSTIVLTCLADESANIFTVTGTDYNGNSISETLNGVNNGIIRGSQIFKTVTSFSLSNTVAGNIKIGTDGRHRINDDDSILTQNSYAANTYSTLSSPNLNGVLSSSNYLGAKVTVQNFEDERNNVYTVNGYNLDGDVISENIQGTNGTLSTGNQIFKSITSILISNDTSGSIKIGTIAADNYWEANIDAAELNLSTSAEISSALLNKIRQESPTSKLEGSVISNIPAEDSKLDVMFEGQKYTVKVEAGELIVNGPEQNRIKAIFEETSNTIENSIALSQQGTASVNLTLNGINANTTFSGTKISIFSVGDESLNSFTVSGTDLNDNVITEKIVGPSAGNTSTGLKIFKTITSVQPTSSTNGNIQIGTSAAYQLTVIAEGTLEGDQFELVQNTSNLSQASNFGISDGTTSLVGNLAFKPSASDIPFRINIDEDELINDFNINFLSDSSETSLLTSSAISSTADLFGGTPSTTLLGGKINIKTATSGDRSGVNFTVVGRDMSGTQINEVIKGAIGGETAKGSKIFKTVTSITPNATTGSGNIEIGHESQPVFFNVSDEQSLFSSKIMTTNASLGTPKTHSQVGGKVKIFTASGGDHSITKFTIVGTDHKGDALTEVIENGPLSEKSVVGGKVFKTISSITPQPISEIVASANVSTANNTITISNHMLSTGSKITYSNGSGTDITGLSNNSDYYAIVIDTNTIKLASSLTNANSNTSISLTGTGNNNQTFTRDVIGSGSVNIDLLITSEASLNPPSNITVSWTDDASGTTDVDGLFQSAAVSGSPPSKLQFNGALTSQDSDSLYTTKSGTSGLLNLDGALKNNKELRAVVQITFSGAETGKTFTVAGYDLDGIYKTDVINGPNSGSTVEGSVQYKEIISITASSATANNIEIGTRAESANINGSVISITSNGNESNNEFTIVGKDMFGNDQTEILMGGNATTVNGKKVFKSITSITPSSATGVNTIQVGTISTGRFSISHEVGISNFSIDRNPNIQDIYGFKTQRTRAVLNNDKIELNALNGQPISVEVPSGSTTNIVSEQISISNLPNEELIAVVMGGGARRINAEFNFSNDNHIREEPEFEIRIDKTNKNKIEVFDKTFGHSISTRILDNARSFEAIGSRFQFNDDALVGESFFINNNTLGTGDNRNINNMLDLQSDKLFSKGKGNFQEIFSNTVARVGSNVQSNKLSLTAAESNKDAAEAAMSEFSGVSLDDEAAHLLEFQQAYQASARLLQTARELFQSLIEVV